MSWRDIWVLYRFEMRAALRERTIVVNSILMPILLYPFMLWAILTGMTFVQGQTEGFVSRVALSGVPDSHEPLETVLREDADVELAPTEEGAVETLRRGELDAWVEFLPAQGEAAALDDNFRLRLTSDSSKERSEKARARLTEAVDEYRDAWLKEQSQHLNLSEAEWSVFRVRLHNMASGEQMGALLLGLLLPIFFVVMVAMGCFHPAVDATAGERERNTWETTLTLAASRISVVTAKYLYVASFGFLAGALNLTAMGVSIGTIFASLLQAEDEVLEFGIPLGSIPILAAGSILLAAFIAAGMMIFAAFARSFREGQSMITPFYLVTLIPVMFLGREGLVLSPKLALVPIVNVALMVREAITGTFRWLEIMITVGAGTAAVGLCLWLATVILRFEDVVTGSYNGNLLKFARKRLLAGRAKPKVRPAEGLR